MYCIYVLLFSKFAFQLCKDYGFGFLYFKSIFEKFYWLSRDNRSDIYICCDSFSLSNVAQKKKTEIFCKMLVGDTIFNITIRYALNCLMILIFVCFLSTLANVYLKFNLTSNFYLTFIFIIYILISTREVRKYENF